MSLKLRYILLFLTAMCLALPSKAVLSEDNIDRTLVSLAADMKVLEENIQTDLKRFENRQNEFRSDIEHLSEVCDETGVVLYSQDERYLYGTLQATQSMKNVIGQIQAQKKNLIQLETDLTAISTRYNELSRFLTELRERNLTAEGQEALLTSQAIADSLHQSLQNSLAALDADKNLYQGLARKANQLGEYNATVLSRVQSSLFHTGNESLPEFFRHFSTRWQEFVYDLNWRFFTGQTDTDDWNSMEDKMDDMLDINTYVSLFIAVCFFFLTRIKRFCPRRILGKRFYWSLILWLALNVTGLVILRLVIGFSPETRMILILESELYLLALLITSSLTIRLKRNRIGRALATYLPMFFLTFMFIEYRQDLVPLTTVTFTAPFLFFIAIVGQAVVMYYNLRKIDKADRNMAWANLAVITACSVITFCGFTVLSIMLFLLWIGIVNGLLLIALAKSWKARKHISKNSLVGITIRRLIYPLITPAIAWAAIVWVTHIYNLTSWFSDLLNTPFINMPDKVGVVSVAKLLSIYGLGVFVNYIAIVVKNLLWRNPNNRQGQVAVVISVGNIIVWLLYVVAVLIILDINKAGLIAAVGGASVGIGFALKDTFENFFCGMSLMTGRLRPGDILEYEGERGKVLDIGIISTRMETEDGPIMTMTNRQLFEKNFKNMTRNHCVELRHITFDISADNDPKAVRELILACFRDIDGVDNTRKHVVIMRNFGSGVMRVELKVWIDSEKYLATEPAVREAVFETFRANGIQKATFMEQIESKGSDSMMTNNRTIL